MKIIIYTFPFQENSGGITALYNLAKHITELQKPDICVKMFDCYNVKSINAYFNDYIDINEIDDDSIIIYPEVILGNPLNKPNVIRWILAPIGMNCNYNIVDSWGKNDLVYYFNSELKMLQNSEKNGTIYKLLSLIHINPIIQQYNFGERTGICIETRKQAFHKNPIKYYIFYDTVLYDIASHFNQSQCIEHFNKCKMFISYDPCTFLSIMASLCGCISVVYPWDGLTKQAWLNTTAVAEYIKSKGLDNLYGIAYGLEDVQYAKDTLHLVKEQWIDIQNFNKDTTIVPFINDIQNFENIQNTVQNNYF